MESEDFITLAGDSKHTSPSLGLPNGKEAKSDLEAVRLAEELTGHELNNFENEAEPGEKKHSSPFLDLPNGNEATSHIEAVTLAVGPTGDELNNVENEAEPGEGSTRDLVGFLSNTDEASLFTESVSVSDNVNNLNSTTPVENGGLTCRGIKRPHVPSDEQPPSVQVIFNSLTRQSRKKLEALLQQWSEWDAKYCSALGSNEMLESGEATYYPALHVGLDKPSTVSFWLDNQTSKSKEGSQMDDGFVPVYDRGYGLALTSGDGYSHLTGDSELVDDSRCFNCGSYNHSLRECPKPRDNAAVKNARKQLKTKRNQNSNSRTPTRYYQNTPAGKYDGLRPGVLEAETRKLLGLRDARNRLPSRIFGEDDEGEPSGLTIFGEEEIKDEEEKEDGEIQDMELSPPPELPTLPKKMSVAFPGINAPIPANADERLWAPASSNTDSYAYRSSQKFDYPLDSATRDQFRESRWSRDSRDDGPPGVGTSVYSYSSRYASYDPSDSYHSPRRDGHLSRSSSFERSEKDRSSMQHENPQVHVSYRSQNYASRSSRTVSDDLRKYGDGRDPYTESSSCRSHREGRDKRYRKS